AARSRSGADRHAHLVTVGLSRMDEMQCGAGTFDRRAHDQLCDTWICRNQREAPVGNRAFHGHRVRSAQGREISRQRATYRIDESADRRFAIEVDDARRGVLFGEGEAITIHHEALSLWFQGDLLEMPRAPI